MERESPVPCNVRRASCGSALRRLKAPSMNNKCAASSAVGISVVVSTRDRAANLGDLFAAMTHQKLTETISWELLVVDNGSSDNTAAVVQATVERGVLPIRYLFEPRKGKSDGLNTGIEAATGAVIAFTDDDTVPQPDWLERLWRHFLTHPDETCVGGMVELYNPAHAPVSIRISRQRLVITLDDFNLANIPVIGCNMAVTAQLVRSIGNFYIDLGPGRPAGVAEDLDFLYRVERAGCITYEPEIRVLHHQGRRSATEIRRVRRDHVLGRGALYCKYVLQSDPVVRERAVLEVRKLLVKWLRCGIVSETARATIGTLKLLFAGVLRYRFMQRSVAGAALA